MEDYEAKHKDDDEEKKSESGGTKRKAESDTKSSKPSKKQILRYLRLSLNSMKRDSTGTRMRSNQQHLKR